MCGIVGTINFNHVNHNKVLSTLNHRGPDFHSNYQANNVWMGHARLSIIDLSSSANQPIQYNKNYVLIYNGEIYNYKELGEKYLSKTFTSDSIFLYELLIKYISNEKLFNIINEFRGMWAFSFLNKDKSELILVRDSFGKKPLYYYSDGKNLAYASEIKAIESIVECKLYPNEVALQEVLKYRFSHYESPYLNINMLPKGHYLTFNLNTSKFKVTKYFDTLDLLYNKTPYSIKSDNVDRIDHVLNEAVKYRMISDVKVGSITSGGLDSSLISAIAHKLNPNLELFNVDVIGDSETEFAKILADNLATKLHVATFNSSDFLDLYESSLSHYEFPMVHPNNIGLLKLSELANKEHTKVLLSGEGADEVFGGYSNAGLIHKFLSIFGSTLFKNKKINFILSEIFDFNFSNFLKISQKDNYYLPVEIEMEHVFQKYYEYYKFFYNKKSSIYASFLALQFEFYTKPLLLRADKMFMANSIELRSPFFDMEVVRNGLLTHPKIRVNKKIITDVSRKYVDNRIIFRKKSGFHIPFFKSLNCDNVFKNDELNFINDSFYKIVNK